jgi:hypothetical protein
MAFNPEAGLPTPDASVSVGSQFDWTPPAAGNEQCVIALDFTLPTPPPTTGMIFEQGGSGRGALIIVRDGYMRFRFGDGGTSVPSGTQGFVGTGGTDSSYVYDVPISSMPFDGNQHTIVWEIEPRDNGSTGQRAWVDGGPLFATNGLGAVESNQWSGSAGGGFLQHTTNMSGETNFDNNWPVQTGACRLYLNTLVVAVPTTTVQAQRWTGSTWDLVVVKAWSGWSWLPVKFWDGSEWLSQ